MDSVLLELHYLPSVPYFAALARAGKCVIEQHENYQKGSYRNRCVIAGSNGTLRLSIPLEKGKNEQTPIREVRIHNGEQWQRQHWESIRSGYGRAPYFDYYGDILAPFYFKKYEFLFDFNLDLFQAVLPLTGLRTPILLSEAWETSVPAQVSDQRNRLWPNDEAPAGFQPKKYAQVFEDRYGFTPNLSIIDLLFCAGPRTLAVIGE